MFILSQSNKKRAESPRAKQPSSNFPMEVDVYVKSDHDIQFYLFKNYDMNPYFIREHALEYLAQNVKLTYKIDSNGQCKIVAIDGQRI